MCGAYMRIPLEFLFGSALSLSVVGLAVIAEVVTQVTVSSVPWYKERLLQKISLGSLLMIVLLRTAHYNLAKLKVSGLRSPFNTCLHCGIASIVYGC